MKFTLKKTFAVLTLAALVSASVFAQSSTDWLTVATVTYNGTTAITGRDLREAISRAVRGQLATSPVSNTSALESAISNSTKQLTAAEKRQVLDSLINFKLMIQAARKANTNVTDTEVNNQLNQYRSDMAQQLQNPGIQTNDDSFAQALYTYMGYSSIDDFKNNYIRTNLLVQNYIQNQKGDELKNVAKPTDDDVNRYYRIYRSTFVQPELLTVYYIAEQFTDSSKSSVRSSMNSISSSVGRSGDKFSAKWMSLAGATSGPQAGQWNIPVTVESCAQFVQQFGEPVLDELMELRSNDVSSAVEGTSAYFILKVQKDVPPKLLSLSDNYPGGNGTMDSYIRGMILNQNTAAAQQKAQNEILDGIRQSAKIRIDDANLAKVIGS
jgi:hypothetical protein